MQGLENCNKLARDLFDYTLQYNVYDEIMQQWKFLYEKGKRAKINNIPQYIDDEGEQLLYEDIYLDLVEQNGYKALEQLKCDFESGWEETTQEYKDIMKLGKRVEARLVVGSAIQNCIDNNDEREDEELYNFGYGYIRDTYFLEDDEETIEFVKQDDRVQDIVGMLCDESLDIIFTGDFMKEVIEPLYESEES